MTASLHAFPDQFERDQLEFDRTDSSPYIRAIEEAAALAEAVMVPHDRTAIIGRIEALSRAIERMAAYRDDLDDLVDLGHDCVVELRAMPAASAGLCGIGILPAAQSV